MTSNKRASVKTKTVDLRIKLESNLDGNTAGPCKQQRVVWCVLWSEGCAGVVHIPEVFHKVSLLKLCIASIY